jgi:hypothetical protein
MSITLASLGLGKSRKVRHRKTMTPEKWAALEREADVRAQVTSYKTLAAQLDLTEDFIAHTVSRLVRERRGVVPRLAHVFALRDDDDGANMA